MSEDASENSRLKITDSDLLTILREADSPVLQTRDIVERDDVPIGARQVERRLKSMEEQGLVGSSIVTATPEALLWWHNGIEVKRAWPTEDGMTSEIGVEAVDVLDLPGRDETLRKRREAVDAVFRYLFDEEEEAVASELRLVGWGADMETYRSSESLWNNCLKTALRQSYFFQLQQSEKTWQLSQLGFWLKDRDEQGLWRNWESNEADMDSMYHNKFLSPITAYDKIEKLSPHTYRAIHNPNINPVDFSYHFSIKLDMDGPVWVCEEGTLYFTTVLSDNPARLRDLFENKDRKESELVFDVTWEDRIDNDDELAITRCKDINLDASALIRATGSGNPGKRIRDIKGWVKKTRRKMIDIL